MRTNKSSSSRWNAASGRYRACACCIEPYGNQIEKYRSNPMALERLFDAAGIAFIDASNGEADQSTDFITSDRIPKTIADHVAFARDFLQPLSASHWKCHMGARPPSGPSDDQLKRLADTLDEIGRQTLAMGSEWLLTLISGDRWNASTRCAG